MQSLTVRDLRYDFGKVEAWLADGQEIEITKHGKPVARLCPPGPVTVRHFDADAHRRRMERTWGDRVFTAAEVREMREAELGDRGQSLTRTPRSCAPSIAGRTTPSAP